MTHRLVLMLVLVGAAAMCQPAFEAASVKLSTTDARGNMRGGPGTNDPGQITMTNVTLFAMMVRAYDVKSFQIVGPDWISQRKYEVVAKVPAGASKEQSNRMLQTLLADRFHLTVHREWRDLRGYDLVVPKSAKLTAAKPLSSNDPADLSAPPTMDAQGYPQLNRAGIVMMEGVRGQAVVSFLTARHQPISALVDLLGKEFRLPIADRTNLSGDFDFRLEYAPERPGAVPSATAETPSGLDSSAPNLLTALQQQLGLKLNPAKVRTEMVVLDRADPVPVAN